MTVLHRLPILFALLCLTALPARAEAPRVVASIAPLYGLAAAVMDGVAEPRLLLPQGASPHHHALRPSDSAALQDADLILWIGPLLESALTRPLSNLGAGDRALTMLEISGLPTLPLRGGHGAAHDHAEDSHADHGDAEHAHAEHGLTDPHIWLGPQQAIIMAKALAERLSRIDPAHADQYRDNAASFAARIDMQREAAAQRLAAVRETRYVLAHDSLRYFEAAFGLAPLGSLSDGHDAPISAARLRSLTKAVSNEGGVCLFVESGGGNALSEALAEESRLRIAEIDLLGTRLTLGPALLPELLSQLAADIADCLAASP